MSWDDEAANWNDNPAVKAYSAAAFESLEQLLDRCGRSLSGLRILDFGCGGGLLTASMAAHAETVVGLDVSAKMIDVLKAQSLGNVDARVGSLHDHPDLVDFDLVTCSSVLAFVDDHPRMVAELAQRLSPGGLLVHWDWELDPAADEPFGLSCDSIPAAIAASGLETVEVGTAFERKMGEFTMAPLWGVGRRA